MPAATGLIRDAGMTLFGKGLPVSGSTTGAPPVKIPFFSSEVGTIALPAPSLRTCRPS